MPHVSEDKSDLPRSELLECRPYPLRRYTARSPLACDDEHVSAAETIEAAPLGDKDRRPGAWMSTYLGPVDNCFTTSSRR